MITFADVIEHQAFTDWKERHPEGIVINWKTQSEPMLHRASCGHMVFKSDDNVSLTKHQKDCFQNKREYDEWSAKYQVKGLTFCKTCSPRT